MKHFAPAYDNGPNVYLVRTRGTDHGTEGIMFIQGLGFFCFSLEPPDRDNTPNMSCIPIGTYTVALRWSRKYGWHYHVTDVQGRSFILAHSGNLGGDRAKGLLSHTWGCLLFGKKRGVLQGQRAVLYSRATIKRFMNTMNCRTFKLQIIGGY